MATLKTKLLLRNDTTSNWTTYQETILSKGEAGVEWYVDSTTKQAMTKLKIGDGSSKWSELPYIQQGMINTTVSTSGTGNTVVGASVTYANGVYSITLTKANRVVDIKKTDDGVVKLTVTQNWTSGHTIDAKHDTHGPSATADTTSTDNSGNTPIDPKTGGKISIPQIKVNKYGHTTTITNQEVKVSGHDITVTADTAETNSSASGKTIVGVSKGGNHEIKYVEGYRLTRTDTTELTADTVLLGNGGYDVKTSSKKISALDNGTIGTDHTTIPTSKTVKGYVDARVASAVQYLGVVSSVTGLSTSAGQGDFYRASADFSYTNSTLSKTVQVHAGDIIVALRDKPTQTLDVISSTSDDSTAGWGVIHGEEIGVASIAAADKSIVIGGTSANPTIKVNTGYTTNGKNYKVQVSDTGLFVNVPWTDTKTEYSVATSTSLGLVKLGSDTEQSVAANAVSSTANRSYAVQLNASDQMVVNVPWTDTTYTATDGIKIENKVIKHTNAVTAGTASGTNSTTVQALGATITLPTVTYDAQGHITAKGTTSFVLPDADKVQGAVSGYGQITPGNTDGVAAPTANTTAAVAKSHKENIKFTSVNQWIVLSGVNNETTGSSGSDEIKWGHKLSGLHTNATAQAYGLSANKTLEWKESTTPDSFTVIKPTIDAAGHVTGMTNMTVSAPNSLVSGSLRGLVPKISVARSFLISKDGSSSVWDNLVTLDGGNASTGAPAANTAPTSNQWGYIS